MKWFLPMTILFTSTAFARLDPIETIRAAAPSSLTFKGKALMTGSISVKTCVFENADVYVLYGNCTKKEAPATNIKIVPKSGGVLKFSIENSDRMEKTGPISTQPRSNYDSNWTVSFVDVPAPVADATITDLDILVNRTMMSACYIGGILKQEPNPTCFGDHGHLQAAWEAVSVDFWVEPGPEWYAFLKDMRKKANLVP